MTLFTNPPNSAPKVEPQTATWLNEERYLLLLYADAKRGKTFAYCSIIERCVADGKHCYVINTDDGFKSTFRAYFGKHAEEVAKHVTYYRCSTTKEGAVAVREIVAKAQPGDWTAVDLLSSFWNMAQDEFIEGTGMDPIDYIRSASVDPKKFGLIDGSKWQVIKRLDNLILDPLLRRSKSNVVAVCGTKDVEIDKAFDKKKLGKTTDFDAVALRPDGQKVLPYRFETIVLIGGFEKKFFRVVGHRGKNVTPDEHPYDRDFWSELKKYL